MLGAAGWEQEQGSGQAEVRGRMDSEEPLGFGSRSVKSGAESDPWTRGSREGSREARWL